ncbi:TetR/AcrR family transcriptional regulator [Streptomyces sp. NPDC049555]|uniref:TetR/AcrR family transcriptional regulator n=1 Tax=Streptomyces sp. NPDC049555 TaxID=3154930 RepID=UPI0034475CBF
MHTTKTAQQATGTADAAVGTRERIVRAAARLLQRQGYEGTGIKQIAGEAGATLGSVYHFFPGGKQELAVAAIRHGEGEFADMLTTALSGTEDPAAAIEDCTRLLATALRASDWTEGCPVAATALETVGRAPAIQRACAEAIGHWTDLVAAKLCDGGLDRDPAHELAGAVISTLEGAELTAQVLRSEEPLLSAGRHLARLVRTYV